MELSECNIQVHFETCLLKNINANQFSSTINNNELSTYLKYTCIIEYNYSIDVLNDAS